MPAPFRPAALTAILGGVLGWGCGGGTQAPSVDGSIAGFDGPVGGSGGGSIGGVGGTAGAGDSGAAPGAGCTLASGSVKTFQIPLDTSLPQNGPGLKIIVGPDHKLWFTQPASNKVGRATTTGEITLFPLPTATSYPTAIAAGPDGNIWFTEGGAKKIGRITPSGTITELPLPTGSGAPGAMVAGADGSLWFVEQIPDRISRITPSGDVTSMMLPTGITGLTSLTVGPDSNIWFISGGGKIGYITSAGAVTMVGQATGLQAGTIVAGPDGNLWFIERIMVNNGYDGGIGRITPSGGLTEFTVSRGTADSLDLADIAVGPDGNLWFTEALGALGGGIGSITVAGDLIPHTINGLRLLSGITEGPDGHMWFLAHAVSLPYDFVACIVP